MEGETERGHSPIPTLTGLQGKHPAQGPRTPLSGLGQDHDPFAK